ncbi:MAG: tRNA (adenosine(37)-N6)-threonylcarbamoyltransferase complex dimerization subunit type 1 TsaB [Micrococcales bacterium]|nr:tRNA (adenosine(37)-N6)-threonylcarbamoyltransferase complex dimerization subunit type 1 TsaB [Micrococcales bacterium]
MLMLALDTSTSAITVAVHDGETVLGDHTVLDARRHTELLAPGITTALAAAGVAVTDLTDIAVGVGPGPFTGLRVGLVTALTLGHTRGIAVHGVCSLDALAQGAGIEGDFLVATDARRKEVYWARYRGESGVPTRLSEPVVGRAADIPAEVRALPVVGRGALLYPEALPDGGEPLDVYAGDVALVAQRALEAGEALPVEPMYLRRPDALTTAERQAAVERA